jgi:hypothetical protein
MVAVLEREPPVVAGLPWPSVVDAVVWPDSTAAALAAMAPGVAPMRWSRSNGSRPGWPRYTTREYLGGETGLDKSPGGAHHWTAPNGDRYHCQPPTYQHPTPSQTAIRRHHH